MSKDSIKFGDKDYALVPARLKKFRESNPRASIITAPTIHDDGSVTFQAKIVQDRADDYSAEATGTAHYDATEIKKAKAFEKLETISVGRALANIGYLNDGQVATTEEMEEFEQYRLSKVEDAIESIKTATKRGEFQDIMAKLNPEQQKEVTPIIKARMAELKKEAAHAG